MIRRDSDYLVREVGLKVRVPFLTRRNFHICRHFVLGVWRDELDGEWVQLLQLDWG